MTAEDESGATYTTPLQSFVVNEENDLQVILIYSLLVTQLWLRILPLYYIGSEPTDADLLGSIANYDIYISTDNSFTDVTPQEVSANTYTDCIS